MLNKLLLAGLLSTAALPLTLFAEHNSDDEDMHDNMSHDDAGDIAGMSSSYIAIQGGVSFAEDSALKLADSTPFGTITKTGSVADVGTTAGTLTSNGNSNKYAFTNGIIGSVAFGMMFDNFKADIEGLILTAPAEDNTTGKTFKTVTLDGITVDGDDYCAFDPTATVSNTRFSSSYSNCKYRRCFKWHNYSYSNYCWYCCN